MILRPEPPVCTRSKRCMGCPYPGHGFICWSSGEQCLRTLTQQKERSSDGMIPPAELFGRKSQTAECKMGGMRIE